MRTYELLKMGVIAGTALTIPFYVAGYFPPEQQGDKHPPHEHTHASSGNASLSAGVVIAPIYVSSFAPSTRWTIRS